MDEDDRQQREAERTEELPVTAADVDAAIRGAIFPATVAELLSRAQENGAEPQVLDRIATLPLRKITSLGDALRVLDMLS